jgi:hypothetical protein
MLAMMRRNQLFHTLGKSILGMSRNNCKSCEMGTSLESSHAAMDCL